MRWPVIDPSELLLWLSEKALWFIVASIVVIVLAYVVMELFNNDRW